ncbi:MAG TPA: Rrf2 family transcriptional regulator [Caulobacteraceae bacterium]|nr:Rrf2 family transcriptional regulator [Caulobacteraceae bacterium]
MRLSTKGRYAVMAMVDLARHSITVEPPRAVSLAEIARRQDLSLAYLEQLFTQLRRAGLVVSVRGPGGGYRLSRSAPELAVSDIVAAVDEQTQAVRCTSNSSGCMPGGERCLTHDLWEALGDHIHTFLAGVSLDDILQGRLKARRTEAA